MGEAKLHLQLEFPAAWFHGALGMNGTAESPPEEFCNFQLARNWLWAPPPGGEPSIVGVSSCGSSHRHSCSLEQSWKWVPWPVKVIRVGHQTTSYRRTWGRFTFHEHCQSVHRSTVLVPVYTPTSIMQVFQFQILTNTRPCLTFTF